MEHKIILSADSTCDLGANLKERYHVHFFPFHILLGEDSYVDGVDIQPEDLYRAWREKKQLPKTSTITIMEYEEYFQSWVDQGYDVIHINLGSAISSAHQNCVAAAAKLGHVYPVDSCSLSTGMGLLVIHAAEMIEAGADAPSIQKELKELSQKVSASFVLDTLEFMRAGGRCSAVAAIGANLLHLKPSIVVENAKNGAMSVGKKYRGSMEKVLEEYVRHQLERRDDLCLERVFITHSGCPDSHIQLVKKLVCDLQPFKEVFITQASCTISCHCGPGTLGVLFMTK